MYAQKLSFDYAHTLHTVRIVHNAHSIHRSRVQKGQSCDCINFVRATDPACGSGGMFVQAARYMHNHNASESEQMKFRCYGVEKEPDTVKLAKMNLLLNNVRGDITEANSFYSDPYNAVGQFDYVMANPPFNVDEVVVEKVSDDARFNTYGVPRNKSKSTKKKSDKKETVPNANYLWMEIIC